MNLRDRAAFALLDKENLVKARLLVVAEEQVDQILGGGSLESVRFFIGNSRVEFEVEGIPMYVVVKDNGDAILEAHLREGQPWITIKDLADLGALIRVQSSVKKEDEKPESKPKPEPPKPTPPNFGPFGGPWG